MINPFTPSKLQVWAQEDTAVQLTWGDLPAGPVTARCDDAERTIAHEGGPGAIDLTGLRPGRRHRIEVAWDGGRSALEAVTLAPPPGELLARVATVSDLHLGARRWGAAKTMRDRSGHPEPFPWRCAKASVDEAWSWGAELLVVKGDAAHHQRQSDFDQVGRLLDSVRELPVLLIPGNHDVNGMTTTPVPTKVGHRGIPYIRDTAVVDLAGLRVIVGDSTVPGHGFGTLERIGDDVIELASEGGRPFLFAMHHQLTRRPYPDHYPLGIPAEQSLPFLDRLGAANPRGLITSGHTHRNRARRHGPLQLTEVASTRDWPGVWAGYAIHEGGIRQVVRRAAAAPAITWHEYSRKALGGIWEWWSAGAIRHRCFTHRWPTA